MPTVGESLGAQLGLASTLRGGIGSLSNNATFVFDPYVRLVLPIDGFVFWANASIVSPQLLAQSGLTSTDPIVATGSLHYAVDGDQSEDENIGIHRVIFTTQKQIQVMGEEAPGAVFMSTVNGVRFSFSRQDDFYTPAGVYHYVGDAVYPAMLPLIIDDLSGFDDRQVVSNSLPIWLTLDGTSKPFPAPIAPSPQIPMYPSFAVPDNLTPPYGAVHIFPESTRAIQAFPTLSPQYSHHQLCTDRVRVTLYGLRNDDAQDWMDYVFQYSVMTDNIGIMNIPTLQDAKRTQKELAILAMKKTVEFEVSYYQHRTRTIAQQYIKSCIAAVTPTY